MVKERLDVLLVEKGMVESRTKAQALIMAGQVRVNGQMADRPATSILKNAEITIDKGARFVSRGGEKLEAALQAFPVDPSGCVCVDVGASTGGFTDCLLQHGAAKVYAIDVGKGILHWKLRTNRRVVLMEETNARFVEKIPEPVNLVVIDASFISLKVLLPVVKKWFLSEKVGPPDHQEGNIIALIKPQFEAGRKESAKHKGVIRDPLIHSAVLLEVLQFARMQGFKVIGLIRSPVMGPKGNIEFLSWLGITGNEQEDLQALITGVL